LGGGGAAGGFGAGGGGGGPGANGPDGEFGSSGGPGGVGGAGGFGGGGGGGGGLAGISTQGNAGDFFNGQGGAGGAGGFGGGAGGAGISVAGGNGGGGLGAGGDIFIQQGGSVTIAGGVLSGGSVTGGAGAAGGQADGTGVFLQGNQSVAFGTGQTAGQLTDIEDVIADQTGSGGIGANAGAGSVVIEGVGTVKLGGANTYTGGTSLDGGTLQLASATAAGSGAVTFAAGANATLLLDALALPSGGTYSASPIAGFDFGDTIDFAGLAYANGPTANLSGSVLSVTSGGVTDTLSSFAFAADVGAGAHLDLSADSAGGTELTLGALTFTSLSVGANGELTFSGAVSDQLGGIAVTLFNGATEIGAATVNASAETWSLTLAPPAGIYKYPTAIATDSAGNPNSAIPPFTFVAGITGKPYTTIEDTVDASGATTGQQYFNANGSLYLSMHVTQLVGGEILAFSGGSFFTGLDYSSYSNTYSAGALYSKTYDGVTGKPYVTIEDTFDPSGAMTGQQYFNANGSLYLGVGVSHPANGDTVFVYSGGSFFTGLDYNSYWITDNSAGARISTTFYGVTGQPYTSYIINYDSAGKLANQHFFGFTGRPYTSDLITYDSSGSLTGQVLYQGTSVYLADTVSTLANGETAYNYYRGSALAGKPYASYQADFSNGHLVEEDFLGVTNEPYSSYFYLVDSAGHVASQTTTNTNGTHRIKGFENDVTLTSVHNDTMTGGGSSETFVLNPLYGQDTITDFASHDMGTGHDTISLATSEFINFAAVTKAAANLGSSVTVTAGDGDMLRLTGLNTTTLAGLGANFTFHS
jgi:hypothetical protein